MENISDSSRGMYEVEKIINYKTYRNKKYYLVKWLCYPIYESTWEPKSNLKNLNYMIDEFESEYPYSIDHEMYNIYCQEIQKKSRRKNKRKTYFYDIQISQQFLKKKKKIEYFSASELKDKYFDTLKIHLHLDMEKRHNKTKESEIIIELSSSTTDSDESIINIEDDKENMDITKEKDNNYNQLIMPLME